ncbi:hypothetical protein KC19_4G130500 [Ceratodon purpureus]|uniref:Exostosin GT47 domain-containing protein n=1 Tax=Ceratodon purpureus TaxID=3225 RepID=A0A8T0I8H1_CERPU|nr:hypothetical protein KC19_4G130500 [Ceratodon purpureus]
MKGEICRSALVLCLCSIAVVVCFSSINSMKFLKPACELIDVSDKIQIAESKPLVSPLGDHCNCTDRCPPPVEKIVEKEVVKEVVKEVCSKPSEPWYVEGKTWHYPARFPLCSMDACFNYTKCESSEELLIFTYNTPAPPKRYFSRINESKYFTADPNKACIFLVFLDADDNPWPPHPSTLPHWNDGRNHALVIFADKWAQRGPHQASIGMASVMASDIHETTYRPGFDISIPLPGNFHVHEMQPVKILERKYLATFRGLRYLGRTGEGVFRSYDSFRGMHNGKDVIVATSCDHPINNMNREKDPAIGVHCDEDALIHRNYTFNDLMNTTFALVPAGVQPSSYRFIEVLSAGAIPVLIADNYVKPFDTLILWYKCLLQFPTTEMHRIVGALRAMKAEEIVKRQEYCLAIYEEFLKDDETLMRSTVRALKARFLGAIPNFTEVRKRR